MTAAATGDIPAGDAPPPPQSRSRASRLRTIKQGIKLVLLLFLLILIWLMITAPLSQSLGPIAAPSLTILSAEGEPIARRGSIIGEPVDVTQLPPHVGLAFVAVEDRRFYYHSGLDPWGMGRALVRNTRSGSVREGGSTITQQLAKTSFLSPDRTYVRKAQEALIALWLEARLTKNQILSRYLSNVSFGDNVYGLRAAARHYFNVAPEDLSLAQSAMLAGVVNAPSRLAPSRHLEAARRRARLVLQTMVESGFITEAQRAAVRPARLRLGPRDNVPTGTYFADWVLPEAVNLDDEGYGQRRIRTTLEGNLQRAAVRAVRRAGLGRTQAALVAMRLDGRVVAMVGGRDYAQSVFNRATQARRQPGSAFKVFVYLAAFRAGLRPESMVNDAPIRLGDWRPRNYGDAYRGAINVRDAVAFSSNSVAVQISERVGRDNVIRAARDLGLTTAMRPTPSLPLGVNGVSLLELTAAYAGIASGRFPIRAYGLPGDAAPESSLRRDPAMAYMREVLYGVVQRGTGRAANLSMPTFGKTGTTSDYRDALFVGFAGDLVVGVWIGNDDNSPLPGTSGGGAPARIWRAFMTDALGTRAVAAAPVPLSQADRGDENIIAPANGVEIPAIPADTPPVPDEPLVPEGNAVTLPVPPRVEPLPEL